jgi:hypothetical protein
MNLLESTTNMPEPVLQEDLVAAITNMPEPVLQEDLVATMKLNVAKAMRRLLENKNVSLVVRALVKKGPMSFGELKQETQLERNDLNHALLEMKTIGLAIQLEDKKYSLTLYCATILKAMNEIGKEFREKGAEMLLPVKLSLITSNN